MRTVRRRSDGSHCTRGSNGWARVAGLVVVGAAGTVTAVLTDSGELTMSVVSTMLPFLP